MELPQSSTYKNQERWCQVGFDVSKHDWFFRENETWRTSQASEINHLWSAIKFKCLSHKMSLTFTCGCAEYSQNKRVAIGRQLRWKLSS